MTLEGTDITGLRPRDVYEHGVGYVPADRHRFGLVLPFSIADNLVLTSYHRPPYARGLLRNDAAIRETRRGADQGVRHPHALGRRQGRARCPAATSRRWSSRASSARDLKLLVLDQPTRGLDVGSIEFIHRQMIAKRDAGTAILLVSAELDEVLELSDRIAVMYRGRARRRCVDGRTADKNEIGLLMATGGREATDATKGMAADADDRRPGSAA